MARTVVGYLPGGFLNAAASTGPTGSTETVTGLPIATGLNVGQFQEFSDTEAAQYSSPNGLKLYGGTYMWVQLDPAITGTTKVKVGAALFWLESQTGKVVTTTSSANAPDFAGVSIDSNFGAQLPYAFIQQNGKASVLFNGTLANSASYGDTVNLNQSSLGVWDGTFNNLQAVGATTAENLPSFVGNSLVVAVAGGTQLVRITRAIARF